MLLQHKEGISLRYFDLHCDTMTECFLHNKHLKENDLHVNLQKAQAMETYAQCYAVWSPDSLRGDAAFQRFCEIADRFQEEAAANRESLSVCRQPGDLAQAAAKKKHAAVLTVENGAALGGKLENIQAFRDRGVKMCTLTWNGENELGRGVGAEGNTGLSNFGRQAVKGLEEAGIVIDLSHASPALFYDVAEISQKPLAASHSNAKSVCSHPRNLTDEQFCIIRDSGGLVGLNFYKAFLHDEPEIASMEDVLRHAEHFLALGGENTLAMGGDWDGAALPKDMADGLGAVPRLYELFLKHNYPESLVKKIFYENGACFFQKQNLL